MGDYFQHWINLGKNATAPEKLPRFFFVNWFRKEDGKFLWPGYGENSRVLAYIFDRCNGEGQVKETPIGKVPSADGINIEGLNLTSAEMEKALAVCADDWKAEVALIEEHYASFGKHLPEELSKELKGLRKRLGMDSCCCCG